jgi:ElaB/YqjD/DUF883 family membrane-anchored ribosome-binding protein/uncharacterized protein YjbJ (UPF0337 family)
MSSTQTPTTATTTNSGAGANAGGANGDGAESGGRLSSVRQSAADAYEGARERTTAAYAAAREAAGSAIGTVRDTASTAATRTADGIDTAPMAAVIGGIALGALAGALLPRTAREEELLGPTGRRLTGKAKEAMTAARDASRAQLDGFTDRAVSALKTSAGAAAQSVRQGDR